MLRLYSCIPGPDRPSNQHRNRLHRARPLTRSRSVDQINMLTNQREIEISPRERFKLVNALQSVSETNPKMEVQNKTLTELQSFRAPSIEAVVSPQSTRERGHSESRNITPTPIHAVMSNPAGMVSLESVFEDDLPGPPKVRRTRSSRVLRRKTSNLSTKSAASASSTDLASVFGTNSATSHGGSNGLGPSLSYSSSSTHHQPRLPTTVAVDPEGMTFATPFSRPKRVDSIPIERRSVSLYETSNRKPDYTTEPLPPPPKFIIPVPYSRSSAVARSPCTYDVTRTRGRSSSLPLNVLPDDLKESLPSLESGISFINNPQISGNGRSHHRNASVYRASPSEANEPEQTTTVMASPIPESPVETVTPNTAAISISSSRSTYSPPLTLPLRPPPKAQLPESPTLQPERELTPLSSSSVTKIITTTRTALPQPLARLVRRPEISLSQKVQRPNTMERLITMANKKPSVDDDKSAPIPKNGSAILQNNLAHNPLAPRVLHAEITTPYSPNPTALYTQAHIPPTQPLRLKTRVGTGSDTVLSPMDYDDLLGRYYDRSSVGTVLLRRSRSANTSLGTPSPTSLPTSASSAGLSSSGDSAQETHSGKALSQMAQLQSQHARQFHSSPSTSPPQVTSLLASENGSELPAAPTQPNLPRRPSRGRRPNKVLPAQPPQGKLPDIPMDPPFDLAGYYAMMPDRTLPPIPSVKPKDHQTPLKKAEVSKPGSTDDTDTEIAYLLPSSTFA